MTPSESIELVGELMTNLSEKEEFHVTFGVGIPLTVKLILAVVRQKMGSGMRKRSTTGATRTKLI